VTDGSSPGVSLRAGGATDVGRMRTVNQDRLLIADGLYAVADGMGGHAAGDVAAQVAMEAFQVSAGHTIEDLVEAVKVANMAVIQRGERDPKTRGMGTTLCAVALVDVEPEAPGVESKRLAVLNVGDSRVYLYQGGELLQLTEDHSLVEDMVREGQITAEEARDHPARNIVTRVLGNEPEVDVDVWEVTPNAGDRFLLCSDGLFGELTDDQITAILRRLDDPDEASRELVRLANDAGGRDNISVVLVDVIDDAGLGVGAAQRAEKTVTSRPAGPPAVADDDLEMDFETGVEEEDDLEPELGDRPRRLTWRVALFTFAVLAVIGAGIGLTAWYARSAWYVGIDDERVVIFRGRPDGILWFDPTVEEPTSLSVDDVPPSRISGLRDGKEQPSLDASRRYVANLREEAQRLGIGRETTTTTSTSVPAPTTTVAGG